MLELKDIVLDSRRPDLLQPFSVVAEEGRVTTITAPEGAGKTWLMKAVMGLAAVESGYITVDGELVTPRSAALFRRQMAYLPQDVAMPAMPVSELMKQLWSLRINAEKDLRHADVRRQWKLLGVESRLWEASTDGLADGLVRRILLSAVAMTDRPIVLLDMPLLGLTAEEAGMVEEYVRQLAGQGKVVVMTNRKN